MSIKKTKQHVTENNLTEESKFLGHILDQSPVGVGITVDGVFKFCNSKISEFLGVTIGDISINFYVKAEQRELILKTLNDKKIVSNIEIQLYNAKKEIRDVMATFMPYRYQGEKAILAWIIYSMTKPQITNSTQRSRQRRIRSSANTKLIKSTKKNNNYFNLSL